MKRVLSIGAWMCILGGFGSSCDKVDPFDPLTPDDPCGFLSWMYNR